MIWLKPEVGKVIFIVLQLKLEGIDVGKIFRYFINPEYVYGKYE
ncbi:hypothetical protein [Algoriphagus sp.]|jgi:hypothetical protein|nr:hypothetical protein [Algoriphagus sp.]MDO8966172.1 hypothetical protein [Algoriphagus sp.]MDP3200916.1 hypothetical protein [Algoriphagus sp.]